MKTLCVLLYLSLVSSYNQDYAGACLHRPDMDTCLVCNPALGYALNHNHKCVPKNVKNCNKIDFRGECVGCNNDLIPAGQSCIVGTDPNCV